MAYWNSSSLTWFITGASSGFGLALTRIALSEGHKVIATSRNPSRNPDLVAEVESQGGRWLPLDVDDANCGATIEKLETEEGTGIDILVNNAGWSLHGPAECITEEEARRQMETMYFGPYRLLRAAVPHMRARRRGLILNIGSGAGVNGRDSMGAYAASKAAMDGLLRVMTRELAPFNIRTLNVHLGAFDTNFTTGLAITKTPFPDDYRGSITEKVVSSLAVDFNPDGDHRKAIRVVYEIAIGKGQGEGKEKETVVILGRDMWRSMQDIFDKTKHMMDISEDMCNNVYLGK